MVDDIEQRIEEKQRRVRDENDHTVFVGNKPFMKSR